MMFREGEEHVTVGGHKVRIIATDCGGELSNSRCRSGRWGLAHYGLDRERKDFQKLKRQI